MLIILSLERIIESLVDLGLTRVDAEVYVYIAKKGSQKTNELTKVLNHSKYVIDKSLKSLVARKLIVKDGSIFSAVAFEKALELFISKHEKQKKILEQSKEELVATWETED